MTKKNLFRLSIGVFILGIALTVFILFVPMKADNEKIILPTAQPVTSTNQPHGNSASALAAENLSHGKSHIKLGYRAVLIDSAPIAINPGEDKALVFRFQLRDTDVQNVRVVARIEGEVSISRPEQLLIPDESNLVTFSASLNSNVSGRHYVMFDVTVNTSSQSIHSAPTGVVLMVGEQTQAFKTNVQLTTSDRHDRPVHRLPVSSTRTITPNNATNK